MLAEPKRKVKYSLNPRGNEWVNDSSKFGQRMLEKMGWSQGKGLGSKEDGIREHLRLDYSTNSEGLGWKEKDVNPELNHNYERALADLHKHHVIVAEKKGAADDHEKSDSLSLKTTETSGRRKLKVRHRYGKVLRSKDTSCYSQEDMAKIFAVKVTDYLTSGAGKESPESRTSNGDAVHTRGSTASSDKRRFLSLDVTAAFPAATCTETPENNIAVDDKVNKKDKRRKKKRRDMDQEADEKSNEMQDTDSHQQVEQDCERDQHAKKERRKKVRTDDHHMLHPPAQEETTTIPVIHEDDAVPITVMGERTAKSRNKKKKRRSKKHQLTPDQELSHEELRTSCSTSSGDCADDNNDEAC